MRKIIVALVLAASALIGALTAPRAEAQGVDVSNLTPFTQEANYMSLAGYVRWITLEREGRWISRQEAEQIAGG